MVEQTLQQRSWPLIGAAVGFILPIVGVLIFYSGQDPFGAGEAAGRLGMATAFIGALVGYVARRVLSAKSRESHGGAA